MRRAASERSVLWLDLEGTRALLGKNPGRVLSGEIGTEFDDFETFECGEHLPPSRAAYIEDVSQGDIFVPAFAALAALSSSAGAKINPRTMSAAARLGYSGVDERRFQPPRRAGSSIC